MTERIESYRDLRVWNEAMNLAEGCCRLTKSFPRAELYGLTSQIRRSAASVPANIAEGYGRDAKGSYIQFLKISRGSLKELETHLLLATRVELTTSADAAPALARCETVGKMLNGLIRSLEARAVV